MRKLLFLLTTLAVGLGVFADADNLLYTVYRGGDTYADGTAVQPGEWYALVFLPTGSDGIEIAADCTVVDAAKGEIVKVQKSSVEATDAPICFQLDAAIASTYKGKGSWAACLLDTRTYGADGAVTVSTAGADGKPVAVNASRMLSDAVIAVAESSAPVAKVAASVSATDVSAVPADAPTPEITSLVVADGKVRIKVANTVPYLTYNLASGGQMGEIEGRKAESPKTGVAGGEIELVAPATAPSAFFRVNRN